MKTLIVIYIFYLGMSNYLMQIDVDESEQWQYSLSPMIIDEWNQLTTDYVPASSVNMFKYRLDKYAVSTLDKLKASLYIAI